MEVAHQFVMVSFLFSIILVRYLRYLIKWILLYELPMNEQKQITKKNHPIFIDVMIFSRAHISGIDAPAGIILGFLIKTSKRHIKKKTVHEIGVLPTVYMLPVMYRKWFSCYIIQDYKFTIILNVTTTSGHQCIKDKIQYSPLSLLKTNLRKP